MEELRDLNQMANKASSLISKYEGVDFELPQLFKDRVTEINSNSIKYNQYSAIIETKGYQNGTLNIYMPNQWFYVASYFTDLYNELMKYKKYALQITSKDRLKVLNGSDLTTEENRALTELDITPISKELLTKFITDYSWWGGAKTIDRGDFFVSPILSHAKLVNASQSFVADLCGFLADKQELVEEIINHVNSAHSTERTKNVKSSLQQIYYGAPGTGKSFSIDELTNNEIVYRTTFHPDSDYATFVGAYKPMMIKVPIRDDRGFPVKENGEIVTEKKIVYDFCAQVFTKAYIEAWKEYMKEDGKNVYLIIEEINRGNCAQIFGDLFQLLDRNDDGFSSYDISPDSDLQCFICEQNLSIEGILGADDKTDISEFLNNGELISLPPNLYIWATMNTSDQSLFPIDSAFKRRWDWKYMPIHDAKKNFKIRVKNNDGKKYDFDWWEFLDKVNTAIGNATSSEDKKLGYFFCKADNKVITSDRFVSKVIFYIWNDVFKDYETGDAKFKYTEKDGTELELSLMTLKDGDTECKLNFSLFFEPNGDVKDGMVWKLLTENLQMEGVLVEENPTEGKEVEDGGSETKSETAAGTFQG